MNHQNVMQQYFDPQQQTNMNGFPGGATAFQPNQQISSSFNGPTSVSNPYMTNANFHQNGVSRYNAGNESESFDSSNMQAPPNSQGQGQQIYPNYMDPRMGGFDPRSRPNFDPMSTGMDGYGGNSNFTNKMRMNDNMAAIFNNPAALAALQRQRMGMFNREGDYMSPNNPFSGFNPQAANYIQQQRFAAFQRQIQEMGVHGMQGPNRSLPDLNNQFPPTSASSNQPSSSPSDNTAVTTNSSTPNDVKTNANNSVSTVPAKSKDGFPQQNFQPTPQAPQPTSVSNEIKTQQTEVVQSARSNTPNKAPPNTNVGNSQTNEVSMNNKYHSGSINTPRPIFDQQNSDSQRNAAMLAAAAVRAAAAASSRSKSGMPPPGAGGPNYPYGSHGYPLNPDLMQQQQQQQPFMNQNVQSPDFGVMSPNKDAMMAMNQGRSPRTSVPPPPYSPSPFSNESNHSSSGSTKGSMSNLAGVPKSTPIKVESQADDQQSNENKENCNAELKVKTEPDASSQPQQPIVAPSVNPTMLSAPHTPVSSFPNNASPAPSPFQEELDMESLSPSWPNTPMSPSTQKKLKAKTTLKQYEQLSKVYDLIVDEEKRNFFDRYLAFMSVNGTPITKLPVIAKKTLDLYTLFRSVCERGGIQQVMEKRLFREILANLGLPNENVVLAYVVKEQYMKYLHAYELKAKEALLRRWGQKTQTVNTCAVTTTTTSTTSVPTIALGDSFTPDMKPPVPSQNMPPNLDNMIAQSWQNSNSTPSSSINTSTPSNPMAPTSQYNPRMSYPNHSNQNNPVMSNFNQQSMNAYGPGGQDMPPGYPGFGGYQNPMYQRPPGMQNFNNMRPGMVNDQMAPGWPRGFPPHQGPPELYPEGLQRMPWNQSSSQRLQMSAFTPPNYSSNKSKGKMPQISCDPLEQLKFNAQQQIKLQQLQQQQAQQQQQQMQQQSQQPIRQQQHSQQQFNQMPVPQQPNIKRFTSPDPKNMFKGRMPPPHDLRHQLTPTQNLKREFSFPPNSIEATKPLLKKRKKLTSKDLGPIEAWRIMMSLKSGLVAECTWAIDTLNILLADNNTITYFHLKQLPGLLDTLMDHYRRCMITMFKELKITEIPLVPDTEIENESKTIDQKLVDLWVGVCKNAKSSYSSNIASTAVAGSMNEKLDSGKDFWQNGGGDNTEHIKTAFPTKDVTLKAFPKGIPYVTKAEEEKQRKINEPSKVNVKHENNRIIKSPVKVELHQSTENPTDKMETNQSDSTVDSIENNQDTEPKNCKQNIEPPTRCMQIIDDLLKECEKEASENEQKPDPLITKLLKDFEFLIPCDKKYLDDSKEFIDYLNRRLQRENRGNVKSEQCIVRQSTAFVGVPDSELSLLQRCVAMSNVFRSLSFIQGNDSELAHHAGLLSICAFALLHKHEHAITDHSQFKLGFDERTVPNNAFSDDVSDAWWQSLFSIRENTIVLLANIGGHLNLRQIREDIRAPLIHGLLHWVVCRSSQALDPMPTAPGSHALSAQRLCIETLAKLTINPLNVDYIVARPNDSALEEVGDVLVKHMARKSLVPNREFSIILVDNLAHTERFSKLLASRKSAIRNICTFLYDAEKNTSNYLSSGGRVQPGLNAEEICGTSISLLRRAVNILLSIAKLPCNRAMLTPYTEELLTLSTSQMIDTSVLALLASVLYELSA